MSEDNICHQWLLDQLASFFGTKDVIEIRHLQSLSTNPCYQLMCRGKPYFCKVLSKDMLGDRERKSLYTLQGHLHKHTIAPEPLYFDPNSGIWIEEWLDGNPLLNSDLSSEQKVTMIAESVALIHSLPIERPLVALQAAWQRYINQLQSDQDIWRSRARKLALILQEDQDFCFCHNDLHSQHIYLHQQTIKVIDWEYAGVGHRAFDLKATMTLNKFSEREQVQFFDTYVDLLGLKNDSIVEKVERIAPVLEFTNDLWLYALKQ